MLKVENVYGHKVRTRVCGIYIKENKVLLANHPPLSKAGSLWLPPGGRVEFGSSMKDNLVREFREETGLDVTVSEFMFINEFINPPLHAVEVFFRIKDATGVLKTGTDPELEEDKQIISDVKFMDFDEINALSESEKHSILNECSTLDDLLSHEGYFIFENK